MCCWNLAKVVVPRGCWPLFQNRLQRGGFLYKSKYEGWYSAVDERFYLDEEVERAAEGPSSTVAKESRSPVEWVEEDNYMFAFDQFRQPIHDWLTQQGEFGVMFGGVMVVYIRDVFVIYRRNLTV